MPVIVINKQRRRRINPAPIETFAQKVLERLGIPQANVCVVFVSDRKIQALNRRYRGKNTPTDVLSFSYVDCLPLQREHRPTINVAANEHLGDLVISVETAERQAATARLTFTNEVCKLIIHGILHLCGYDHESDDGEMAALERTLRRQLSKTAAIVGE
ncbi:MAG: rRNA maturation RNase YbeY [Acidobacteriota bacterium]|nr:rRNA maturation RNase YbeY [Blastocatellia bacterium]MDW8412308.1 rRNA maturation RNase YbeY [Acidobacteriota bacterium]